MPDGTGDKYALGSNWAQNTTVNSILYALYETIIQDVNKTSVSRFIDNSQGGGGRLWSKVNQTSAQQFAVTSVNTDQKWGKPQKTQVSQTNSD